MTYEAPLIKQAMLTNQISSIFVNQKWYLSLGHLLYSVDFALNQCSKVFETESLLSPIVKLNKTERDHEIMLLVVTIDNRVYKISGLDSKLNVQQEYL